MSKYHKTFGFETLEDRVVLSGNSLGEISGMAAEIRPAEFHKDWMELNHVPRTVTPGEQSYTVNETIIIQGGSDASGGTIPTETVSWNDTKLTWPFGRGE